MEILSAASTSEKTALERKLKELTKEKDALEVQRKELTRRTMVQSHLSSGLQSELVAHEDLEKKYTKLHGKYKKIADQFDVSNRLFSIITDYGAKIG